jgi:BMFP domain-containing protein YqiC
MNNASHARFATLPNSSYTQHGPFIATRQPLSRRHFLKGVGIGLALPLLDSMLPGFARAASSSSPLAPGAKPRRMLGICNNLGLLPDLFFPTGTGRDYTPSAYLELLKTHRSDFTVFSGVSHPNVDGGHPADVCFLTAAPHPGSSSFRNTISLDQHIAEQIGILTRFPSITLGVNTRTRSLSWTGTGVAIPPEDKAADVFKQLFLQGTAAQVEAQIQKLDTGRSILDTVAGQARELQRTVGARDRDRLDQYFTSVRDLEHRLQASRGWEKKPKPVVSAPMPVDPASPAAYMEKVKVMYDLARLAFETDSTRCITLMLDSVATPVVELTATPIKDGYHNLSHHGKSEDKRTQLKALDEWHMKLLAGLYSDLKAVREGEESLLDRTMVLYGSNFGDANSHVTTNMPTIFAGGGFRHGQHLAFDTVRNYPLPNLFVSMLQRMGLENDRFASSTGTMRGLEMA